MNLLAAKMYDPAVAVSKATSSLLAMTALDTTNLRLNVTVPAHGMVRFRGQVTITGATTFPVIYLGVLAGSTVVGRVSPTDFPGTANAATQTAPAMVDFVATGLTPGATNFDLAYGVEVVVASTNIKYGGPNDTTTNNAWGAALFEAWDPQPLTTGLAGGVNVTQYGGSAGTFASGRPEVNTTHAAGTAWGSGAITAASIATGAIDADALAADAGTEIGTAVWATTTRLLTAGTNIALAKGTGVTGFNDLSAAQVNAEVDTAIADVGLTTTVTGRIDAAVTTRATPAQVNAECDTAISDAALATAANLATVDTAVAAIQSKTDSLNFTVAGKLDVNALYVNGVQITGLGTANSPWGPV